MKRMSDRYMSYLAASNTSRVVFSPNIPLSVLEEKFRIFPNDVYEPESSFLIGGQGVDCREYLLDKTVPRLDKLSKGYLPHAVYIRFSSGLDGRRFDPREIELLESFSKLVVNKVGRFSPVPMISLSVDDGYGVLRVEILLSGGHTIHKNMAICSFLLWIIRNTKILKWCLSSAEETPIADMSSMFRRLSPEFLINENWGDGANPNLSLSFFAYAASLCSPRDYKYDSDGPSEYAQVNYGASSVRDYVRDVLLPLMESKSMKLKPSHSLKDLFSNSEYISLDFEILLKSLILSEGLYNEQNQD